MGLFEKIIPSLTGIASFVTIVDIISRLAGKESVDTSSLVLLIAFVVITIAYAFQGFYYSKKLDSTRKKFLRDSRYAEIGDDIHMMYHHLRDAWYHARNDEDRKEEHVRTSLDSFRKVFNTLTDTKCRACIKFSYFEDAKESQSRLVKTFARSEGESNKDDREDRVDKNTDFKYIYKNSTKKCFFSNDLLKYHSEHGYINSHYTVEEMQAGRMPYSSTIVWSIQKLLSGPGKPNDIIGYLCIDSPETNVFDDRDINFGLAYADVLYTILEPGIKQQ